MRRPVALIAALARGGVIGDGTAMGWRHRADMRHFRATTMGCPVVMGRRTYETIGKPLAGRPTLVVSRGPARHDGALWQPTLAAALATGQAEAARLGADAVFVAGGGEVYAQAMGSADRLVLTLLDLEAPGDVRFPEIDPEAWREVARDVRPALEGGDAQYTFLRFERRAR